MERLTPGLERNYLDVSHGVELSVELVLHRKVLGVAIVLQPRVENLYKIVLLVASQDLESLEIADVSLLELSEGDVSEDRRTVELDSQVLRRSVGV